MSSRDLHNNLHVLPAIPPSAATVDNTPWVSSILDTTGYAAAELVLITGTELAPAAAFNVLLEDGNDPALADHAPVLAPHLLGTDALASFTGLNSQVTRKVGYLGSKRYLRATVTPVGNNAAAYLAAVWALGIPRYAPAPNPPM